MAFSGRHVVNAPECCMTKRASGRHGARDAGPFTGEPDMAKTQKAGGKAAGAKTAKAPAKEAGAAASKAKKAKK
ncbi:hypothetical protein M2A_0758 [Tepidicaulis marinus]|uniref:Uncharacterized protein n=1 Tax=Tepidicaulis marinus TaxID=1333998 RepID=A0A081B891_9HYPH|nr:hypothetical protein M2A_0758 [Tepidicaulis marinus]